MKFLIVGVLVLCLSVLVLSRPQGDEKEEEAEPYEYKYDVKDKESGNYYGHEEKNDGKGKTEGKYQVWLADGRLMTVEYTVDGDSGYKPKITFTDSNYMPPE